jgi:SAM-dependent methyltransferase
VLDLAGKEKLHRLSPQVPRFKLNLGCGTDWRPQGVINIDCRNLLPPDGIVFLRADVADLREYFNDGCAEEIWAHDVLEHFPQGELRRVLDEWVRLLAPGGILHLRTPDLDALAKFIAQPDVPFEGRALRVYGGQSYTENFHKAGLSIPYLSGLLTERRMRVIRAASGWPANTNLEMDAQKVG